MNVFELFAKLKLDKSDYEKGLEDAGNSAKKGMSKIAKVGLAATAAATGASVAFAKSAVDTGKEFDASMSQVAATMGKTMAEMENEVGSVNLAWGKFSGNLRDYAQEMGANTAFSATQAAEALNYMALAGYDAQTSMQMLPNVLNLAAAGGFELATASDMITDTQTAFGISLERTTLLVDEMAKAASTGNTSVEQLGNAFLTVGGLASELNGGMVKLDDGTEVAVDGIQELEIALTAMANAGVKGNEAGTHMRNMLLKLSSPSAAGTKALEKMGVKVFDTSGKMRSLSNIFGDLNKQLSKMTQEQKIQTISDLFNTRDLASAEALLNAVGEDWDNIGASILEAQGSAQKMADTQLDNLAGDTTLFQSALEGAKIAISDRLTPAIRTVTKLATDKLGKLTDFVKKGGLKKGLDNISSAFSRVKTAIQPVIDKVSELFSDTEKTKSATKLLSDAFNVFIDVLTVGSNVLAVVIDVLSTFIGWINSGTTGAELFKAAVVALTTAFVAYKAATLALTIAQKGAAAAQLALNVAMNANPIGAVVLAITGLVTAIAYLWKNCENFRNFWKTTWENINTSAEWVVNAVGDFLTITIPEKFNEAVEFLKDLPSKAYDWGKDLIQNFKNGIEENVGNIKKAATMVGQEIKWRLGFSEPKLGPLANFHSFSPDMMELFASGITDNVGVVTDAVSKAFDLKSMIVNPKNVGQVSVAGNGGDIVIPVYIGQERIDEIIVASEQTRNYRSGGR